MTGAWSVSKCQAPEGIEYSVLGGQEYGPSMELPFKEEMENHNRYITIKPILMKFHS